MIKQNNIRKPGIIRFIILLISALIVISSLFYLFGTYYIKILLPLFSFEIEHINPDYEIVKVNFVNRNSSNQLHFTIKTHRMFVDEQGKSWPSSDYTVGISTYALYIHPVIIFSLLLSLPALSIKDRVKVMLISLPFLLIVELIDIPFHVIYILKEGYTIAAVQHHLRITWYHEFWYRFLNTGGRQFLSLLAVAVSVALSGKLKTHTL